MIWDYKKITPYGSSLPGEGYSFNVGEMFDNYTFDKDYMRFIHDALEEKYHKSIDDLAEVGGRLHDYGGYQFDIERHYQTLEDLEDDLRLVIEVIRENPRQLKKK